MEDILIIRVYPVDIAARARKIYYSVKMKEWYADYSKNTPRNPCCLWEAYRQEGDKPGIEAITPVPQGIWKDKPHSRVRKATF
jgi:hypothetical protein